jgi:phosphate starvation-inducible PhoH-like protein
MVVTGDVTQIDLPGRTTSGLVQVIDILRGAEGIGFVFFEDVDVVRHTLVQRIVRAYERYNQQIGAGRQFSLKLSQNDGQDAAASASPENEQAPAVVEG